MSWRLYLTRASGAGTVVEHSTHNPNQGIKPCHWQWERENNTEDVNQPLAIKLVNFNMILSLFSTITNLQSNSSSSGLDSRVSPEWPGQYNMPLSVHPWKKLLCVRAPKS